MVVAVTAGAIDNTLLMMTMMILLIIPIIVIIFNINFKWPPNLSCHHHLCHPHQQKTWTEDKEKEEVVGDDHSQQQLLQEKEEQQGNDKWNLTRKGRTFIITSNPKIKSCHNLNGSRYFYYCLLSFMPLMLGCLY